MHRIEQTTLAGRRALTLTSEDTGLEAIVVPDLAMLCASLRREGVEVLGRPADVQEYAATGATTGIPLLHPWANRLSGPRIAGLDRDTVDPASPLVPVDSGGIAIHGLRLTDQGWTVTRQEATVHEAIVVGRLGFERPDLLAAFPFPHAITVGMELAGDTLTVTTELEATGEVAVPIAFGWHPYFQLPGVPRAEWEVELPVTERAVLDARQLPTGRVEAVAIPAGPLGATTYDDCFTGLADPPVFSLAGGGLRIEVAFGSGYEVAQVYAPPTREVIAFEPMTAPVDALVTGVRLRRLAPGATARAAFGIRVVA